jgi:hypothetical protein
VARASRRGPNSTRWRPVADAHRWYRVGVGDLDLASDASETDQGPREQDRAQHVRSLQRERRRIVFRLRRAARVLDKRERLQEVVYGLLLAAFALALPSTHHLGPDELVRRLSGEPVPTYGLMLPLARGLVHTFGAPPEQALRVIAAVCYGLGFMATLALLRGLGFRRTSSFPAALIAFLAPVAWRGAASPCDFAPGIFGASALLWSLLRLEELFPRSYQWRAILLLGLGILLRPELVLLLPAVAWAVGRHPARPAESPVAFFSVFCVVAMSVAISLTGPNEAQQVEHFLGRTLAGADPSFRALVAWPIWGLQAFGFALLGLHALLFARRDANGQRAPRWLVPWCFVILAPLLGGTPEAGPIGAFLVPAMALGVADGLNRLGGRRKEVRVGFLLLAGQLVLALLVDPAM